MSEEQPPKPPAPNIKTRADDARGGGAPGVHGQPPFIPTDEQRRMVREMAKVVPVSNQQAIAYQLKISEKTLTRHFGEELKEGRAELAIALGTQAINRAMNANATDGNGAPLSKGDPDMLKFVLRNLLGWNPTVEVTGKNGGPIETVDLSNLTDEQLEQYGRLEYAARGLPFPDDDGESSSAT